MSLIIRRFKNMSIRFIKKDIEILLLELKTHKDKGKFESLNYKELVKLQGYLQNANLVIYGSGV